MSLKSTVSSFCNFVTRYMAGEGGHSAADRFFDFTPTALFELSSFPFSFSFFLGLIFALSRPTGTTSRDDRFLRGLAPRRELVDRGRQGDGDTDDGDLQARYILALDVLVIVLCGEKVRNQYQSYHVHISKRHIRLRRGRESGGGVRYSPS